MKILLIAGGWSTEREVSLTGGRVMEKALKSLGHEVTFCDLLENFDSILDLAGKHDFAMLNLHGTPGEDGLVQAMLESVHCPYLGAGPTGSFLSLNKAVTKQVLRHAGLPTAGKEATCAVLGEEALPPVLIEPIASDYFDYKSKYADGGSREICPAPLPENVIVKIQEYTLAACRALSLDGYGRVDFIISPDGSMNILEVNTLPGMTPASLVPKEAKAAGLSFPELLEKLIALGFKKAGKTMPR